MRIDHFILLIFPIKTSIQRFIAMSDGPPELTPLISSTFSDADRVVPVNLDQFDPLNSRDDLIKLLIETGISFSRPSDGVIAAEDGGTHVDITIKRGDAVSAAARAACELAASWIDDNDVQAWKVATGRFTR
jgi:hypothetical protein